MGRLFDNRELSSKKSHPNTQKVNSRCFKLHRSFYNSLDLSNAHDFFPGVEFQRTVSKLTKTKRKSVVRCLVFTSSIKREIRKFHVVVVQRRQKKCTKKRDARAKLLFYQSQAVAFLPFSLTSPSSLPKLPIIV